MNNLTKYIKVIFLTVITCGLYGAYWLLVNISKTDEDAGLTDSERAAQEAQRTLALTWLQYMNRK